MLGSQLFLDELKWSDVSLCLDEFFGVLQVSAHGPGLEKHGVTVNKWAEFTVDTRRAGRANLEVRVAAQGLHKLTPTRSKTKTQRSLLEPVSLIDGTSQSFFCAHVFLCHFNNI